ncbi:hypothetical protein BN8_03284 [Fibrisoma limi BUZ 3]|uniref:Glycosyltransferase RgtA/B/C/D-like domain-containing protein n=1 Tax=Fibrisoma limi BUZ 3 TaxID=1185876 RepID=I2GJR5_9BACT|nr:hypothetical protein [Fibrisoma limi]CCH54140.1 hypothetical protein BN8_03284 [Fibrisoma limi BUZ 3]
MNRARLWIFLSAVLLAAYYLLIGLNGQRLGFHTQEALFLTEKAMIVWQGIGDKLPVIGLTFPVFPFFFSLAFSSVFPLLGPVIASALGMAVLFYLVLDDQRELDVPWLIRLGTALTFFLHPGLLYAAASGRSVYAVLLFGYLFFRSLLAYFRSNTTYHVSLASLFLVCLVFSAFDFAWLCLFLLPLVLFMSLQGLSLRGDDTLIRLGLAFNNLSLRRKLVNKSFALLVLLFMLPLAGLFLFSLLNRVYAGDTQYFLDSPYANWRVLTNQILQVDYVNHPDEFLLPDTSLLISLRRLLYAPLLLLVLLNFRGRTYQLLTLLSPFALIEFLYIKNPSVPFVAEYYQIFLVLGWVGLVTLSVTQLRRLKGLAFTLMLVQILMGGLRISTSAYEEERTFLESALPWRPANNLAHRETDDLVQIIRKLPRNSRILTDDATAYPIIALTQNVRPFVLPYQQNYLSALTNPDSFADFLLIHLEATNPVARFAVINQAYLGSLRTRAQRPLALVGSSSEWRLYRFAKPQKASSPTQEPNLALAGKTAQP